MANQQSVCEMFSKWSKHDFVKNYIIFKISVDFETWLFLLFLNWEPVLWGTMGYDITDSLTQFQALTANIVFHVL